MNELLLPEFVRAIEATHGCRSSLRELVRLHLRFQGESVWKGEVLIFDLLDHPAAKTCYAWSVEGRVTAVLHEGRVDSPVAAVRAAIAAELRCDHCGERVLPENHACPRCGHRR